MLRIDWKLVMCAARERSDRVMQAAYRSIILFILTHILSCLVFFQNVLCSARMAGKSTEKPALARAMASGKARIAQVINTTSYKSLKLKLRVF